MTPAAARADYGVALDERGEPDAGETATFHAACAEAGGSDAFDFGSGRRDFAALWDEAAYDDLTRCLAQTPTAWRFYVKHRIFEGRASGKTTTDVAEIYAQLVRQMPSLHSRTV